MNSLLQTLLAFCLLLSPSLCQSDGNPWKWGRERRCDTTDYDPPCGLCEGVGGMVWGDGLK